MPKKIVKEAYRQKIMAIDPGSTESAYVIWDGKTIHEKAKIDNHDLLKMITECDGIPPCIVIEQIKGYNMSVGDTVFETCVWSGRFWQEALGHCLQVERVPRKEIVAHLCGSAKGGDSHVIHALAERFAPDQPNKGKGTKKDPGFFFGFSKDIWQAFAVAVTYYDKYINNEG